MYQQITLLGRLGNSPEMRYTPAGKAVASFSLAVDKGYGDKKTTLWARVTVWEQQAENCAKYLSKGATVLVLGEVEEPRTWTDKQGNTRASLEITARTVKFIDSKGGGGVVGEVSVADSEAIPF